MKTWIACLIAAIVAIFISLLLVDHLVVTWILCPLVGLAAITAGKLRILDRKHARSRLFAATLAPAIIFILIAVSQIPVRVTFWLYRPQFDRILSQVQAGAPPTTPLWVGPFKIQTVGHRGDSATPYLATNEQPNEINGFIKQADNRHFNLWSCLSLNQGWAYIVED